jgi:hypothetical protein
MLRVKVALATGMLLVAATARARADDCVRAAEDQHELKTANKLVAAKKQLSLCAQKSCGERISAACIQWLGEVEASLPTVVVEAHDANGKDTSTVRVSVDGEALVDALDGTALAVDPGVHRFRFTLAGSAAEEQ